MCVHVSICVHTRLSTGEVYRCLWQSEDVGAQSLRRKVFFVLDWGCERIIKMTTASVPDSVCTQPFFQKLFFRDFYGRQCEYKLGRQPCGNVPHLRWVKAGCNLCQCIDGHMACFPRAFGGCGRYRLKDQA